MADAHFSSRCYLHAVAQSEVDEEQGELNKEFLADIPLGLISTKLLLRRMLKDGTKVPSENFSKATSPCLSAHRYTPIIHS